MTGLAADRRTFLKGLGLLGAAALVPGCATSTNSPGSGSAATGELSLQSNLSSEQAKAAMEKLVATYNKMGAANKTGGSQVKLNTVAAEIFRTQLPTYLTSANPPDVYTWYAGSVADSYAKKDLLLDVSSVWDSMTNYPKSMQTLSTSSAGQKIFVPTSYYWWGMFYRKSNFAKWGVTPPTNWAEFIAVCKTIQSKGIPPIGIGLGDTPWVASAWFDYLNIRINGAPFHRRLLAGQGDFTDPKVKAVFTKWREVLPYFDPKGKSFPFQEATSALLAGKTGMFLIGTFFADSAPKDALDDIDFFQFPIIDPAVPVAEEAPTDGYFASKKAKDPEGVKKLMTWLATAEAQEIYVQSSSGTAIPANPDGKSADTPLVKKGKAMIEGAAELTQFFNRDSSDALQPTADAALTKFLDKPDQIDQILKTWQTAAEKVFKA
ncbi:ABC transporter substrate-binding protein [Kribbella sp. NBC_00889]|uniref:ABC transporter substrate-binding protein n=1 Tax=Kribbella sp. NBC_00889 TaxID=2975974 RepID=UPI00386BE4E8|nr:extracellular solute-binding protein [Kribbella sp. NBC_00889]